MQIKNENPSKYFFQLSKLTTAITLLIAHKKYYLYPLKELGKELYSL